jgi:HEPN domain-containing protein
MAARGGKQQPVNSAEGGAYLSKAHEFLHAARESLTAENHSAAVGNAVHAGILAADAICAVKLQAVWRGEHVQAVTHLELARDDGKQAARHLKRLIPMKTRAEYDPAPLRRTDAATAVKAAERMLDIAGTVVRSAPA